ncbi:UDP-N-acetylmuramate:L-alanyl-gamma-D-glutamyl-meso-diaminopimelate ligase [Cellvibrio japonicus]|uniref:UDP-N-acetylmuramate--L-alanyl-gamma-D-glutamyl-meso-2,6-diaminoheptandioate ligase n=1 Tax=Cellvibrio japonicus (strain Ueda107) TaxID=498211 RepID=B3PCQ4_CELJU|nr:UDP-N-acetylmuramate:L-alanyl-gamma-D-glutamyl-meso-diaminopimelate ligase [Cellvibrio japonicus]ACE82879.1 UDP-N-acetylmuramate:L-alanyl-gamma-D-glutamyl-meso-diaminopimelate ligase [Cellvibrio japonicus Ueda107]QEI13274.1 UDP-N-acetylmuramate:L-alanyl-gamma-D-glutamyl-meso-diaminopimelate ligase [Cellvibrio japonicus]QEI16848.1 UDP-N-acetylmuramate:L-alanyl-gamma-D-glutamyl-meso-diaminopimelate ligase [Cellvibrio japonicus]QEI20426.1 UDP-N-acetylmuramate:L-alanyl-gamma-D-glutamyl-meso-diam
MHVHILGICGTFMGSLAQLAKALGHRVTGSDANVYPPMSTQLEQAGITLTQGFDPAQLEPAPDLVVIGNAMSRGNPAVEYVLNQGIPYTSGPQWLHDYVLPGKWVLAVAGTHGKTTTSAMLTWILDYAGMAPGFLIGGVTNNFPTSARLGETPFFVVEADEYDSAFFDKRSKFVHYNARTVILNNLEFDHADIFPDLAAIQRQFHHLVRTIPNNGLVISPAADKALADVLTMGCWTPQQPFAVINKDTDPDAATPEWTATLLAADGSAFSVQHNGEEIAQVHWSHTGIHNVNNGLAALIAARHVGVTPEIAAQALQQFAGVKRRMECLADVHSIKVYDDFAHHPTAIKTTLAGLRAKVGDEKIIAIIEPRSNTMRMGVHKNALNHSVTDADDVLWYQPPDVDWAMDEVINKSPVPAKLVHDLDELIHCAISLSEPDTHIVIMSNGGFGGVHQKLVEQLKKHAL